jgi:uncharacterized membrane protein
MGDTLLAVKKERLTFIDVMRGIAVIWMIETHVVDVILYKAHKQGWFYEMLNISNGFVAVAFIFCAGAGFWLAAQKKADDYKHFRQPLWVYVRRLLFILVIAYCLHFPSASIEKLFNISDAKWLVFFESDVLQCIVYTSFIALAALMLRLCPFSCLVHGFGHGMLLRHYPTFSEHWFPNLRFQNSH